MIGRARLLLLAVTVALASSGVWAACAPDEVELRGDWGQARFTVEVADTAAKRAEGLMHREYLAPMAGMLFVYPAPQRVSFWMRNTLIPLDMIFADPTGKVTRIRENAIPLDETPIDGGPGVRFVLEVRGGTADSLGISPGSVLRHMEVDQATALWPCG